MDPYERLAAINEEISRLKDNVRLDESDGPVVDPFTGQKVKPKRIKQQMGGPVTNQGKPVSVGKSKHHQEILKAIEKAGNSTENYKKVAARLKAHYDNEDSGGSPFGRSIHDSFDPSKDPNAEADQEFDNAAQALKDAGIAYKALKRIGSLRREKDIFKVNRRDMRLAREVMQDFPNTQIKRA